MVKIGVYVNKKIKENYNLFNILIRKKGNEVNYDESISFSSTLF